MTKNEKMAWIAGIVDGEGSLHFSMSLRHHKKSPSITFSPRVFVGLKEQDGWVVRMIRDFLDAGRIYEHKKGTKHEMTRWQTIRLEDSISVIESLYPYMIVKKEKAEKFLNGCYILRDEKIKNWKSTKRGRALSQENMLRLAEIGCTLNLDRNKNRYSNFRTFEYWEKVIKEIY